MIRKSDFAEIPKGFCQCGCGGKTNIAKKTQKSNGYVKGVPLKYLFGHRNWKGGRYKDRDYMVIYAPLHPRAWKDKKYIHEHILIAEKALGKYLPPKAVIHHHTPDQLVICQDASYHKLLHQRTRALKACGHANWLKCPYCKQYDDPNNMYIMKNRLSGRHLECSANYARNRYKANYRLHFWAVQEVDINTVLIYRFQTKKERTVFILQDPTTFGSLPPDNIEVKRIKIRIKNREDIQFPVEVKYEL